MGVWRMARTLFQGFKKNNDHSFWLTRLIDRTPGKPLLGVTTSVRITLSQLSNPRSPLAAKEAAIAIKLRIQAEGASPTLACASSDGEAATDGAASAVCSGDATGLLGAGVTQAAAICTAAAANGKLSLAMESESVATTQSPSATAVVVMLQVVQSAVHTDSAVFCAVVQTVGSSIFQRRSRRMS